jgi:hypothetical protein
MITRTIGILLVLGALVAAGFELYDWHMTGAYKTVTLGEVWYKTHRASLNAAQAGIQRYLAPWLWDPPVVWLLRQPAWAVLGVPGLLLVWWGLHRPRRRKRKAIRFPSND